MSAPADVPAHHPASTPEALAALAPIRSGMRVFVHGQAATPTPLLEALCHHAIANNLRDITLYHLHLEGPAPFLHPSCSGRIRSVSLFTGASCRAAIEAGQADFMPVFLSDIPGLFRSGIVPIDAALVQLSPADRHGLCSLGVSCDAARTAVDLAPVVIAELNGQMPRTHGFTAVPRTRLTTTVETDRPMHERAPAVGGPVESRIGELVAGLVEDGATLQMGIGAIPDAVLARLATKNDLGIHTEMFSDGLIPLLRAGIVTNARKSVHPGRTVTSFAVGTRTLFEFIHDNPLVEFHPCDRTNDTALIRKNPRVTAINSALQIDLSGQVCADSIGHRVYSGIGGQMDFIRGAALSPGGKAVIALPSTAKGGQLSRIVPQLDAGAGVVTTRGHVHWVVTEHGAVNLHGRTLRERAEMLISIAHPDHRPALRQAAVGLRRVATA